MILRKIYVLPILFIIICFLLTNLYFMHILFNNSKEVSIEYKPSSTFIKEIVQKSQSLSRIYLQKNLDSNKIVQNIKNNFKLNYVQGISTLHDVFLNVRFIFIYLYIHIRGINANLDL